MDAGTDAAAGAVAEVVAVAEVGGDGVVGCGEEFVVEVGGGKGVGLGEDGGVVVDAPDVEDDGGVFGDEEVVDCVVWEVELVVGEFFLRDSWKLPFVE